MKLSIVSTLYRSSATIDEFCRRAFAAAQPLFDEIELVLVNDGSPDDSLDRALKLHAADPRITVVDLSRNFGHHKALMTGLAHAHGELVFVIDSDLEEEPEILGSFYERMQAGDYDAVFGVMERRKGSFVENAGGRVFFSLVGALADMQLPRDLATARLMTRDYVRALLRHREREFAIAHLFALTGFRQTSVPIRKLSLSPTTYTFGKRFEIALRHLTTTSTKLLYFNLWLGVMVSLGTAVAIVVLLVKYFVGGIAADGWTSVIVSVWFFGGLITLIQGLHGVYIANILSETKRRPYTIVRRVHRAADRPAATP